MQFQAFKKTVWVAADNEWEAEKVVAALPAEGLTSLAASNWVIVPVMRRVLPLPQRRDAPAQYLPELSVRVKTEACRDAMSK